MKKNGAQKSGPAKAKEQPTEILIEPAASARINGLYGEASRMRQTADAVLNAVLEQAGADVSERADGKRWNVVDDPKRPGCLKAKLEFPTPLGLPITMPPLAAPTPDGKPN